MFSCTAFPGLAPSANRAVSADFNQRDEYHHSQQAKANILVVIMYVTI